MTSSNGSLDSGPSWRKKSDSAEIGDDNRLISNVIKGLLLLAGIFDVNEKGVNAFNEKLYMVALNGFYMATFVGQISKLFNSDDLLSIFDDAFCACGFLNCFVYLWAIRFEAATFRSIAKRITGRNGFEYISGTSYFVETSSVLKKFCILCGPPYFTAVLLFSSFPIIVTVFTDSTPGSPATMVYPSSYPWSINGTWSYIGTMLFVQLPSICIPSLTYTATVGFVCCTMMSLRQHFQIIERLVDELSRKIMVLRTSTNINDATIDDEKSTKNDLRSELGIIIGYHQFLARYIEDVIKCFQGIVTGTLATFFAVMVMIPFLVTTIQGYYLYRMKMMCAATVILIIFFIYCFIVEMINDLNETLGLALYGIPWYLFDINIKHLFPIFIMQLQHRYNMKAFGMFTVNRALFAQVAKLNFSALNITLLMYSKHTIELK